MVDAAGIVRRKAVAAAGVRFHNIARHVQKRESLEEMEGRDRFNMLKLRKQQGMPTLQSALGHGDNTLKTVTAEVQELGRQRRWQEALLRFAEVHEPDMYLRGVVLQACVNARKVKEAWSIFNSMPMKPLPIYNMMINLLGRTRSLRDAEQLLQELRDGCLEPDCITMVSMISAYGYSKQPEAAVRTLDDMEARGMTPTEVAYGAAMSACGRVGDREGGARLLARMDAARVEPHVGHITSLVTASVVANDTAQAERDFEELRKRGLQPDTVAYTSLAASYTGPGALANIQGLLKKMDASRVEPHAFFFNEYLRACRESGDPGIFDRVLGEMSARGVTPNNATLQLKFHHQLDQTDQKRQQNDTPQVPSLALPVGWREAVDPATGQPYYWKDTDPAGTTTWIRPV